MEKHCAWLHGEKESIHKKKWKIQETWEKWWTKVSKQRMGKIARALLA